MLDESEIKDLCVKIAELERLRGECADLLSRAYPPGAKIGAANEFKKEMRRVYDQLGGTGTGFNLNYVKYEFERNRLLINIIGENVSEQEGNPDNQTLEFKRKSATFITNSLSLPDFAIAHPESGEPCNLFAIASVDGIGRFVLESKITKKRSRSTKWLRDLLPFDLVVHWATSWFRPDENEFVDQMY